MRCFFEAALVLKLGATKNCFFSVTDIILFYNRNVFWFWLHRSRAAYLGVALINYFCPKCGAKSGAALIRVNAVFYHETLFVTWKLKRKQDCLGYGKSSKRKSVWFSSQLSWQSTYLLSMHARWYLDLHVDVNRSNTNHSGLQKSIHCTTSLLCSNQRSCLWHSHHYLGL